MPDYAQCS